MKKPVCNMDCFACIHPDCINDHMTKREYAAEYYYKHREEVKARAHRRYARLRATGICTMCGKEKAEFGILCGRCKELSRVHRKKYEEKKRKAV